MTDISPFLLKRLITSHCCLFYLPIYLRSITSQYNNLSLLGCFSISNSVCLLKPDHKYCRHFSQLIYVVSPVSVVIPFFLSACLVKSWVSIVIISLCLHQLVHQSVLSSSLSAYINQSFHQLVLSFHSACLVRSWVSIVIISISQFTSQYCHFPLLTLAASEVSLCWLIETVFSLTDAPLFHRLQFKIPCCGTDMLATNWFWEPINFIFSGDVCLLTIIIHAVCTICCLLSHNPSLASDLKQQLNSVS
jgi:hypothetical protein